MRILLLICLLLPTAVYSETGSSSQETLYQAYLKEFAFLESQKRDLLERKASLENELSDKQTQIQGDISALEKQLASEEFRIKRDQNRLQKAQETLESQSRWNDVLELTLQQMRDEFGGRIDQQIPANQQLLAGFRLGLEQVNKQSLPYREQAEFYDFDGKKVSGHITWIGRIAAFGLTEQGVAGALTPVGGGELKMLSPETSPAVAAFLNGQQIDTVPFFLFEDANRRIEADIEKTPLEIIESGGVIAWVIVVLGLIAAFLVLLRMAIISRARYFKKSLLVAVEKSLSENAVNDAIELAARLRGSVGRIAQRTVSVVGGEREKVEDVVSQSLITETQRVSRFNVPIMIVAVVSPLLGLLGTVTGMISTFDVITEHGTGDPKLLSGGISIALITTQLGLIVAIPVLIAGNLLNSWANRSCQDFEELALKLLNAYERSQLNDPVDIRAVS